MAKLYVDSNVFFYAKVGDRVFGESCAAVLRRIASKEIEAAASGLVPIEVANALRRYGLAKEVVGEVRAIFSLGIEVLPVEAADVRDAAEIFGEVGVSPYDCLHAATMRKNALSEIISADREFDRIGWLKRLDPRSL